MIAVASVHLAHEALTDLTKGFILSSLTCLRLPRWGSAGQLQRDDIG
jgi:hypothetical protein